MCAKQTQSDEPGYDSAPRPLPRHGNFCSDGPVLECEAMRATRLDFVDPSRRRYSFNPPRRVQ